MALQHYEYVPLLHSSETATAPLDETALRGAASDQEQEERYMQMSQDLHYILVNICSGAASTLVLQAGAASGICGFETYRRLHLRYSLPLGTRSVGYLTHLLKPKFDDKNFEETFLRWEYDLARYETDNTSELPDGVKIAVLLNETTGALQQHLRLRAGTVTTYEEMRSIVIEYYRATSAVAKLRSLQQVQSSDGPSPMDIGAYGYGYGNKGKSKDKGKGSKGKGKGKGKGMAIRTTTGSTQKDNTAKERTKENTTEKESLQEKAKESNAINVAEQGIMHETAECQSTE